MNQVLNPNQVNLINQFIVANTLEKILGIENQRHSVESFLTSQGNLDPNQALQFQQQLAGAYNNLANTLVRQNQLDEALHYYNQAFQLSQLLNPGDRARLLYSIGNVFISKQNLEEAESYFRKSLEIDPNLVVSQQQLNRLQYERHNSQKGYQFTQDWFSPSIEAWQKHLQRFVDYPNLQVLEIGSWEGRSACWLIENILTHPTARITCVDTFEGSLEHHNWYSQDYIRSVEGRFDHNMTATGHPEKVIKLVGSSHEVLRSLPFQTYDLIYIDGSHIASDVVIDASLSWLLAKVGGMIIFDDYYFKFAENSPDNTQIGIDAFLKAFTPRIKILQQDRQVVLEKLSA
ncbi:MAG: tetratricopeptide repeat protein [Desertifilum sp. SIO1I2]|nr:tetratricopeptide repeat protein [Desertifilum sp. SIO1I2]